MERKIDTRQIGEATDKVARHHGLLGGHRKTLIVLGGVLFIGLLLLSGIYIFLHSTIATKQHDIGSGVTVSGDKVPRAMHAARATNEQSPLKGFTSGAQTVSITPSGPLKAPITIRLKLNQPVSKDTVLLVATREDANGKWDYITPTLSDDGQYITFQTSHLSLYTVLKSVVNFGKDFASAVVDNLTGVNSEKASPPSCKDETGARQDNYSISSSSGNTLYWCFGAESGKRVLKTVNNERFPLDLTKPSGFTLANNGHMAFNLSQLAKLAASKHHTVVFPREEAIFNVDMGVNQLAVTNASWDGAASSLNLLQSEIDAIISTVSSTGATTAKGAGLTYELMNDALKSKDCTNAIAESNVSKITVECLGETAKSGLLGAPKALVLGIVKSVGSLIDSTASDISGAIKDLGSNSTYSISVQHGSSPLQVSGEVSNDTPARPGCPSGSPTVTVNSPVYMNRVDGGYSPGEINFLIILTGTLTNPTDSDVRINTVAFYNDNRNADLAPVDYLVFGVDTMELSNRSTTIKAHSSATYKAKHDVRWFASNGPVPTTLTPKLRYPFSDAARPKSTWQWVGANIPDKCQPDYQE